jgi:hypothetical protein
MRYVIGGVVALFTLALAVGALTGRVKERSACCPPSASELPNTHVGDVEDPKKKLRS